MKQEKKLNHDQIMASSEKLALDAQKRKEKAQKRKEEARNKAIVINEVTKKRNAEARKQFKKLEKLVCGTGKNNGHYAEEFFQNAFSKTLTFAGIKFDKMIRNLTIEKKECCEFDIVLTNGDTIAIKEVKNRVHPSFVEELATNKLTQFRKLFPEYANYRIYLGIAGLSFDKSVVKEAGKFGIGMVKQDGKTVEVNAENMKVY